MGSWLRSRLVFLLVGVIAAAVATWVLPAWILQPSRPRTIGFMDEAQHAVWSAYHRAETGYCLALNAVWFSAAVWLVVGGTEIVRARVPARTSSSPRT
jgi:hypothetical protein